MSCWELLELILNSIYFAICLTSFIWRLTKGETGKILIEFEMWSIMGQMAYYIIFLITGFKSLFKKEEEENGCKKFLKNIIFKYLWPFVMNSFAVFYLGYNFKWFELDTKNKGNKFTLSIFLHGLSQAGFLIDIILFGREYKPTHIFDFIVISGIYVAYCFFLFSIKPEIPNYLFLEKNNSFIISLMIVCYFVYLYLYFVYMYIVKFKSGVAKICGGDEKPSSKKEKKEKKTKKEKEKETPLIEEKEEKKKDKKDKKDKKNKKDKKDNQEDKAVKENKDDKNIFYE